MECSGKAADGNRKLNTAAGSDGQNAEVWRMRRKEKRQRNKFSAVLTGALILSTFFNAGASVSFAADNAAGGAAENGTEVSEQAQAQSFRIRTYNDRRAEDDQNIEVTVQFDKSIRVDSGTEEDVSVKIAGSSLDQSPNTENGVSNRTLSVTADPEDDTKLIITIGSVKGAQFVKQTNASIQIQASEAGISHILTADSGKPVNLRYIESVIPCGLEISTVDSQAGAAGKSASVTKRVTHRANVRSMVYIQLLKDGQPLFPVDQFDHEGSYVIHAHAFIPTASGDIMIPELTEQSYAELIVQGFENSVKNLPELSSRFKMTQDGDKIIFEDTQAEEGETLDVIVYAWPYDGSVISDEPKDDGSDEFFFEDVSGWEKEYVYYLAEKGVVKGRTETQFAPLENVTRAEFAKMLAAAAGVSEESGKAPSFTDVAVSSWYAPYVAWAEEAGIVNGSNGRFRPSDKITKQEMAVMIQRYAQAVNAEIPQMEAGITFLDDASIAGYAKQAVYQLQKAGVVSGDINGKFYPQSSATRAQAAKMLAVFLQVTG